MAGEVYYFPLLNSYVVGVHYDEPTKPPATGAVAGAPGSYTPAGAEIPEDLGELAGVTATPATAWLTGQYVNLQDTSVAHWSGTAWVAGQAAAEEPEGALAGAYDPGLYTVAEVQAYVEANPGQADAVYAAESAGKARSTLLDWLEARG